MLDSEPSTGTSARVTNPDHAVALNQFCIPGETTNHLPTLYRDTRKATKLRTWTAKTAPYPPCHRDNLAAKESGQVAGWLRRVTLTYFIAVPL